MKGEKPKNFTGGIKNVRKKQWCVAKSVFVAVAPFVNVPLHMVGVAEVLFCKLRKKKEFIVKLTILCLGSRNITFDLTGERR